MVSSTANALPFFTLPFIQNYVRDDALQVYCLDTRSAIGKWDPRSNEIVIDADYYHGPSVVCSTDAQVRQVWLSGLAPVATEEVALPEDAGPMLVSELNGREEEEEEADRLMYPLEGAPDFYYSSAGRVYYSPVEDMERRVTTVGYQQVTTYLAANYRRQTTKICFFPRYRRLERLIEPSFRGPNRFLQ